MSTIMSSIHDGQDCSCGTLRMFWDSLYTIPVRWHNDMIWAHGVSPHPELLESISKPTCLCLIGGLTQAIGGWLTQYVNSSFFGSAGAMSWALTEHCLRVSFTLGICFSLERKWDLEWSSEELIYNVFCLIWRCLQCQGSNKVVRFVWIGHPSRLRRPSVKWASRRVGRSRWHASIQTRTALTPSIPQRSCLIVPAGGDCYRGFD